MAFVADKHDHKKIPVNEKNISNVRVYILRRLSHPLKQPFENGTIKSFYRVEMRSVDNNIHSMSAPI